LTLVTVYWVGFRRRLRRGWEYFADALEAVALAIVTLTVIFWTLGQIGDDEAISITIGRISVGLPPVSLGIAIANNLLGRDMSRLNPDRGDASAERWGKTDTGWRSTLLKLAATAAGALFISVAIVPTDELNEIATYVPIEHLPIVVMLSLLVSYLVVFAAGFAGESQRRMRTGPLENRLVETVVAYAVAVGISGLVLWLFRFDPDLVPFVTLLKMVLLALPASVAAAAGRLAV
jgi:putative integral membrane protein (TIGR02587 family)